MKALFIMNLMFQEISRTTQNRDTAARVERMPITVAILQYFIFITSTERQL